MNATVVTTPWDVAAGLLPNKRYVFTVSVSGTGAQSIIFVEWPNGTTLNLSAAGVVEVNPNVNDATIQAQILAL